MCGIAALVSPPPRRVIIRDMIRLVRHRGPDHEDSVSCHDIPAALGHTRLAVLDLSQAAHQPMHLGALSMVYNGEVYNHDELREELLRLDYTFHGHGDTEVVLAAYDAWGEQCLQRFNGMFALVVVDSARRRLFAARDRLGIKPLYYTGDPGHWLALASEIKQFSALPSWRPRVNTPRMKDFLARGLLDHTAETLFDGIFQLRGGQCLQVDLDPRSPRFARPEIHSWWELPQTTVQISPEEAAPRIFALLNDAVRLQLRADVPVGSCLSGGLDSSAIVCLTHELLGKNSPGQQVFSSCAAEPRFDERRFSELVVRRTGVRQHLSFTGADALFETLYLLTRHQDEPFTSTSVFAQWQLFARAREQDVTVMLDGQGADELFAGYRSMLGPYLTGLRGRVPTPQFTREAHALVRRQGPGAFLFHPLYAQLPATLRKRLHPPPVWLRSPPENEEPPPGNLEQSLRRQLLTTTLPMLLHYEDRNALAHSREARVPFLDHRLVELAMSLPDPCRINRGMTKHVLRLSLSGHIPEKIRTRTDKMGFVTPETLWACRTHTPEFRRRLHNAAALLHPLVHASLALEQFDRRTRNPRLWDPALWRLISAGAWMDVFDVHPGITP